MTKPSENNVVSLRPDYTTMVYEDPDHDPLNQLASELSRGISQRVSDRASIEQRWIEDYQQFLGEYDDEIKKAMAQKGGAQVYLNLTRQLVNQTVAQLADMLFPTDQKNWGIGPTPKPSIAKDLQSTETYTTPLGETLVDENDQPATVADVAQRAIDIIREKAKKMEKTIDDQLVECTYYSTALRALYQAAIFGSCVIAGPEATVTYEIEWEIDENGEGTTARIANKNEVLKPMARLVPLWDFFPDLSANTIEDSEDFYERSLLTTKQLRKLKRRAKAGYLSAQIDKLLTSGPSTTYTASNNIDVLKQMAGISDTSKRNRYEVWTYTGPIKTDALLRAGVELPDGELENEYEGTVVFTSGVVIKVALNPLDIEEHKYSLYCLHNDEFSLFGSGVPRMSRNEQRIINTAWRLMLDNSTKAAGPQIVAKQGAVTPQNGEWGMEPWKLWLADETIPDVRSAFSVFPFPSVQGEIANILSLANQYIYQTGGLPPQSQQSGQGQVPSTLGGMAMMTNSQNADRRRQVRDWDNGITKPLIRRFYHWNMHYNPDPEIKGDFEVHARGTSALLLREQQAINIMALLDKYAAHPALAHLLKSDKALEKIAQAMHIAPDEIIKSPEEVAAEQQQQQEMAAQQPQEAEQDPAQAQQQLQLQIEGMRAEQAQAKRDFEQQLEVFKQNFEREQNDADRQLKIALAQEETARSGNALQVQVLKYAQDEKLSYQKILADLKKNRWKYNQQNAMFQKEVELKKTDGPTANYGLESK
jgi:hypothetical protein